MNELIRAIHPWPHYTPRIVVEMLSLMGDHTPLENPPFEEGGEG